MKVRDLTGERFGRLTVIELAGMYEPPGGGTRQPIWRCRCAALAETLKVQVKEGKK